MLEKECATHVTKNLVEPKMLGIVYIRINFIRVKDYVQDVTYNTIISRKKKH